MFAIALSLLTAFSFACASLFAQRGLHLLSTPWGVWITLVANCIFLWGLHLLFHPEAPILIKANLPFVLIGLFVPGVARMLIFRGIRTIGSSMTATVESSTPMFSTILAITFLHERPGLLVLSGICMIVIGLMSLSWVREKRSWSRSELLFPLSAAFLFMFSALHLERVTIVSPIVSSHSVFILFLAPFVVRGIEVITPRKVVGAIVVVTGIFVVSLGRN